MKKEEIEKMRKELEANFNEITKQMTAKQEELQELANERAKISGEYRMLEKLEAKKVEKK
jgi:prefoldin subunit 5